MAMIVRKSKIIHLFFKTEVLVQNKVLAKAAGFMNTIICVWDGFLNNSDFIGTR